MNVFFNNLEINQCLNFSYLLIFFYLLLFILVNNDTYIHQLKINNILIINPIILFYNFELIFRVVFTIFIMFNSF